MATKDGGRTPRAVIHKRILEAAESDPEASLQALAGAIAGASPDLVERVLERYGDPGEAPTDATSTEESTMPEQELTPSAAELTEKQRETLRAIAQAPEATQAELADTLSVSRGTVNKRLNDIDGFDWADRGSFVESVLDVEEATSADEAETEGPAPESEPAAEAAVDGGQLLDPDAEQAIEQLQERVARLERRLEGSVEEPAAALGDTELLAKVMRAVMADDGIAEDEEVAILDALR